MFKIQLVTQSSQHEEEANMATSFQMWELLDFSLFYVISWIIYHQTRSRQRSVSTLLTFVKLLGYYSVPFLGFSQRLSVELDPSSSVTWVWKIGCSLAASHPICLSSCVELLKRLYYEDLVVIWLTMSVVACRGFESWQKLAKIWPSEVDRGVVNWRFQPLRVVKLSSCFVYSIPRASTLKLWWSCSCKYLQFCPGRLENQRYEWAKMGKNSALCGSFQ